jgi:hypothetical protein
MNTLEQAILGPIRSELIGHNAIFYTPCGKITAENITEVELDDYGKLIRITADKIVYAISGTRTIFESNQRLFHVSNKYEVIK